MDSDTKTVPILGEDFFWPQTSVTAPPPFPPPPPIADFWLRAYNTLVFVEADK